jgi:ATP-dependent helicase Lhr and Lhr-like helicase
MLAVYQASDLPRFLDGTAARLLGEGRATFTALGLDSRRLLESGDDTIIFPWRGDRVVATLAVALAASGTPVTQDGLCLTVAGTSPDEARQRLRALAARRPDPLDLAATVRTKVTEKHDDLLPPDLLDAAYAARSLDVDGAWAALPSLTA